MITMEDTSPEDYFKSFGAPKNISPLNSIDRYRFKLFFDFLAEGSILDIGVLFGGFLKYVRKKDPSRVIFGTEMNEERAEYSNQIIGEKIIRVDFRNGQLGSFEEGSVDNIVCSEVFEHLKDNRIALKELCRVAKKRVIISVPYNEKIFYHHCIHCWKYTPAFSHLHSYQLDSFDCIVPEGWYITSRGTFGNLISKFIAKKMDAYVIIFIVEKIFSRFFPNMNSWMYVVLTKKVM